jgi:hypothetical protein
MDAAAVDEVVDDGCPVPALGVAVPAALGVAVPAALGVGVLLEPVSAVPSPSEEQPVRAATTRTDRTQRASRIMSGV